MSAYSHKRTFERSPACEKCARADGITALVVGTRSRFQALISIFLLKLSVLTVSGGLNLLLNLTNGKVRTLPGWPDGS